ncbi:MAG TPA: AMP-dependent synthetase [Oceanospirillaceae bacterium]|nr:AMP-dependent synthetase [Oceanospirillaceae bacterium]
MPFALDLVIRQHAVSRADHRAVKFAAQNMSYSQFNLYIDHLAQVLMQQGVAQGDTVATLLPNGIDALGLYFAVTRIGATVVPLSCLLKDDAVVGLAGNADCKLIICQASRQPGLTGYGHNVIANTQLNDILERTEHTPVATTAVAPSDSFNIVYSSGTTGSPKGIVHSQHTRTMYGYCFSSALKIHASSVVLHSGSIVFNGAFVTMLPTFLSGASYILMPAFDPVTTINTIASERVTHTMLVPSQLIALLESDEFCTQKLSSLEVILVLGAPLLQTYKNLIEQHLPGRLHELYGLTEGVITVLDNSDYATKSASVGCAIAGAKIRIVDAAGDDLPTGEIGEIVGNGPLLMQGYYGQADLTAATYKQGWMYTGDMGYLDADGFLYLADRKKDMIISGGINVYPTDIEELIAQHQNTVECAVFGVPSKKWGETPVAVVISRDKDQFNAAELRAWVNARVSASYQKVSAIHQLKELPRNIAGKTLKNQLRDQFSNDCN